MSLHAARRRLLVTVLRRPRPFDLVLDLQRDAHARVKSHESDDALILCEHAPVVTVGKRAATGMTHVRTPLETLRALGIDVRETDRGGDVTYHGPGQVMAYPVMALRRAGVGARAYVEGLEGVVGDALREMGIEARGGESGREGVWVGGNRKIAAIGVKISGGTSAHGTAVNVNPRLEDFEHIVPCGLEGSEVTSVVRELGREVDRREVETRLVDAFARRFGYREVVWDERDE